jgi:hypothetical protein
MLSRKDSLATALFAKYQELRMSNLRLGRRRCYGNALIGYLDAQHANQDDGHEKS